MELISCLLPNAALLQLDAWHMDAVDRQITLWVTSMQRRGRCPCCYALSRRRHSWYARTLADLPWAGNRVCLRVRVRKFFCDNAACRRCLFTEPLSDVAAPWARRTVRFAARLTALALALGGVAGVRLSRRLGMAVSHHTLLRMIRRTSCPSIASPRVLGIDDFAMRKRQSYGTVVIDLERRQSVALLPNRNAETLAQWLTTHPGVQVIARDRSKAYADGACQGAPAALQVAARFHLLQNLAEALAQVFTTHGKALDVVNDALGRQPVALPDGAVAVPVPPPRTSPPAQQHAAEREVRRQTIYAQVWALHRHGWTVPAIAQHVGISTRTIFRYLRTPMFPARKRRSDHGDSLLNPHKAYLVWLKNLSVSAPLRFLR